MIRMNKLKNCSFEDCIKENDFDGKKITSNPTTSIELDGVYFNNCWFENIDFTQFKININNIDECTFINCDLSNVMFDETIIFNANFKNCKMQGTFFNACTLENTLLEDINGRYINFSNCHLKKLNCINSDFFESRFMECDVKEWLLSKVNFRKTEFINVKMNNIDFSDSNIDDIITDIKSLKGIKVNAGQALMLSVFLGIEIV